MSLGALIVVGVVGGLAVVGAVQYLSGKQNRSERDPGDAILEFARAYPGEAVRSVKMTTDGKAGFLRIADGKTGFIKAMGRHFVARMIVPSSVVVEALEDQPGLRIEFHDSTLSPGDYIFDSTEDAAEVSLWLCGSLAMASPKTAEPDDAEDA